MALLEVRDLRTSFFTPAGEVKAVNGVSFNLDSGKVLGIVGESGSGKSVTAYSILQILTHPGRIVGGSIKFKGQELVGLPDSEMRKIRGNRISIIFQDPMTSLNPVYTVGNQLVEAIKLHTGRNGAQARDRAAELLSLVGINEPEKGMAILMITHDLGVIAGMCDEVIIMYAGGVCERGTADKIFYHPQHEYTKGLLRSIPNIDSDEKERLVPISGTPIDLLRMPSGCPFTPRCEKAMKVCLQGRAPEVWVGRDHLAACWMNYKTGMEKGLIEYGENGEIVRMKLDGGDEE